MKKLPLFFKNKSKNKKNIKTVDITFLSIVLILVSIGLVMLYSSSFAYALLRHNDSFAYIRDQLIFSIIGLFSMFIISKINYRVIKKLTYIVLAIAIVLLVVVLFMQPLNNARRWIIIKPFGTIQPSEIAKFAIILFCANWLSDHQSKIKQFKYGVLPFICVLAIVCGLMILEPHLSGTVLIVSITLAMMWIGGTKKIWFGMGGLSIGVLLLGVVLFTDIISYASDRLKYWLDPFQDALNKGFQTVQSLLAIGSGGFLGVGLGASRQKYLYVPEPQNDFIFSIICEELGFVGAVFIIGLFIAFILRGFYIATRAKDQFGALMVAGLIIQVGLQALLNIAVVTNTIPNTGISLPFFSYGGSSLIMLLSQMGIVLSISRSCSMTKD